MNNRLDLTRTFLTDAGLETDLMFNRGIELPCFSSVTLLRTEEGRCELQEYFRGFLDLARRTGSGCILESATWRASVDWAEPLGLSQAELSSLNASAIALLLKLKDEYCTSSTPVLVSGCIGPRGDGYDPGRVMTVAEAEDYHRQQAETLVAAGADLLSAITMTNIPEAQGIACAARSLNVPVVISFTVETDGRLPTGDDLSHAITTVDAETQDYPAYYMINCAHPTHFLDVLGPADWLSRVGGVRANASRCSHAELDAMTELDAGDPAELARLYCDLQQRLPHLRVLGGCCGTDLSHVSAIAAACIPAR